MISLKIDWFDLPVIQGALKSPSLPAPQLESISSSVLCLLYGPTLITVPNHWEDHSLDLYGHLSLLFNRLSLSSLSCQEAIVFCFHVCIRSDFGAQERKSVTFTFSPSTCNEVMGPEIKRCLLLGRKVMTNLDSIFKSRDITLPTKVDVVKAMVFPAVTYGCESW